MRPLLIMLTPLLGLLPAPETPAIEFDVRFTHPMFHDPELQPPQTELVFYDNLRPVWFDALSADDPELRRLAADTIAVAYRKGMRGLEESESALLELLHREDTDARIRRAAAKALVALEVKHAAAALAKYLPDADVEYALVVEPALARWNYQPIREQWLSRLREPAVGRARLQLAFECLATVKEKKALDPLVDFALDRNAITTVRLAAARAASEIDRQNLTAKSATLLTDSGAGAGEPANSTSGPALVDRLVGTTLLRRHSSQPAIELLRRSALDRAPTVAGVALRALFDIDPQLVVEQAEQAVQSHDVNVRRVVAEALAARGDAGTVELLATLLDDPHRELRRYVSDQLVELAASDEMRKTVIAEVSRMALTDRWRGLEQAMHVLGSLDHEPSAPRMLELLHHPRPEVGFAAAWALRVIALEEVLPNMLQFATDNADKTLGGEVPHDGLQLKMAQLAQAFGQQRYAPAEPLLRRFVPKVPGAPMARAAAIWTLGFLHENKATKDLSSELVGRISDMNPLLPEDDNVKDMSAVTLARMKSTSAVGALRRFSSGVFGLSPPAFACDWAIEQLTDENRPSYAPINVADPNWFLAPIELAEPVGVGPSVPAKR